MLFEYLNFTEILNDDNNLETFDVIATDVLFSK